MSDLFSIKTFILQSNRLETASTSASVAQISEPPLFFLDQRGFYIKKAIGDGNCFFRAVSLDLTGKEEHFNYVRGIVCDEIEKSLSYFHFLAPPFYA
jgi:hypothetical protein